MTPLYKTSDWHLGVCRSAGTTPTSSYQLRQDLLQEFGDMLTNIVVDGDLLLNGDLFEGASIPMADLAQTLSMLDAWLVRTGRKLWLPPGNHDLSKSSLNFSSYQFLAHLLVERYPDQVKYIDTGTEIGNGCYVLPHVANQDLLEIELARVPACDYLFVHANYASIFAQEMDHSLTISEEQARALPVKHIIFSHEHIGRIELGGKVVVVGNPRPSSISDCLGNATKRMLKITDAGMEFIETWKAKGDFYEQDWKDLKDEGRFIRITGNASPEEASRVVDVVARFRRDSNARVVSNAVKIGESDTSAEMVLSHEEVTSFNVMAALREYLGPDDAAEVDQCLKEQNT